MSKKDLSLPQTFPRAALAAEMAAQIHDTKTIAKRFDITLAQLRELTREPAFNKMLEEFTREWESPMNVKERVRLKAAIAAEDGLAELYGIFQDVDLAPAARLDAFKQITTLADVQPSRAGDGGGGGGFQISINLGTHGDAPEKPIQVTGMTLDHDTE